MNTTLSKIIDLLNSGNYLKAENELRKIYPSNPYSFDLNKMLGLSFLAQRKYNPALKCFERCYEKNKKDYEITLNLSYLFTKIQFYEQSIKFCNDAIAINPDHPSAYQNLATSYFHLNKYEKAEEYALKSIELSGGFESRNFYDAASELVEVYGNILLAQKKTEEFVGYANKILNLTYNQSILIKLLRVNKTHITEKHLDTVSQVLVKGEELKRIVDRNTYLSGAHFFLAEYHSKSDKKKSEESFIEGNKLIADMQRESLYIRQKTSKEVFNFFRELDSKEIENFIDPNKGKGLIFVLGMPRSGTTLTESVLASADNIVAGGEKSFFSLQLHSIAKDLSSPDIVLDKDFFDDLGNRYLENISLHRNGNEFFIDKLPENYLFYKFIKLALPAAKFINCYRDPWDNAISLFKQNYSIQVFFASSFFGIALEYANYERLINFWKELDGPKSFFDVRYEELATKNNDLIKELWDYCGIKGEFSEAKRKDYVGYTASFQQVSKDIYDTSIKKADFTGFKEKFYIDLENQRSFWNTLTN